DVVPLVKYQEFIERDLAVAVGINEFKQKATGRAFYRGVIAFQQAVGIFQKFGQADRIIVVGVAKLLHVFPDKVELSVQPLVIARSPFEAAQPRKVPRNTFIIAFLNKAAV